MTDTRVELSREIVAAAAVDLVMAEGADAVTGTRIADELGVSQPALYRHINGIDDVWRDLGLHGRERLAAVLSEAGVGRSGPDAVIAVANAWRDFALGNRELYVATDRYPCAGDEELEAAVENVVNVLAMTLRSYRLDDESATDAARMLRSFLHGFVHLELGDGHPAPYRNGDSFERIVSLLSTVLPALDTTDVEES